MLNQDNSWCLESGWCNIYTIDDIHIQRVMTPKQFRDYLLDKLYNYFRDRIRLNEFDDINHTIDNIELKGVPLHIMLGVLSSTLCASSHIKSRDNYYHRVFKELNNRGIYRPTLLNGLEGISNIQVVESE